MVAMPDAEGIRFSGLDPARPIHLAGVAGSAMSGLALMLREKGFPVDGTDPRADAVRGRLSPAGVTLHEAQDGSRIAADAQLVVASAALPADHPELAAARERRLPVVSYPELLGAVMAERMGVAISGTHGKTTVTSMVVHCLLAAGGSPGFVIGGTVPALGTGAAFGGDEVFVAEACEYKRSFLQLAPKIAVITGIEADHLDVYKDIDEIKEAFSLFAAKLPARTGTLIHSALCENTRSILPALSCRKRSFGIEAAADVSAHGLEEHPEHSAFEIRLDGAPVGRARLRVPGRHNVANALAAVAVCRELNVDSVVALKALEGFQGAGRRFEPRGAAAGIDLVDDYAHHPTEIRSVLQAARVRYPFRRIVVAFQPHQYSRTRLLLDDFAAALSGADRVVIPDIYEARDTARDKREVRAADLVDRIARAGIPATCGGNLEETRTHLAATLESGDVLITAGAGDIDTIIPSLLDALARR